MKKLVLILSFIIIFFNFSLNKAYADEEKNFYAKINSTSTYLCSMPSETSQLFELPYSYFVKVNYIIDDYFKVTYDGIEGYVKKDKVSLMNGIPQSPFASASFKVFVPYSIYNSASSNSTKIADIDTSTTLKYYGSIAGQQLNSSTNIWYYCSIQSQGQTQFGYVFSGITDYLTKINTNSETFEIISDEALSATETSEFKTLSTSTKIMLIIAISLPSLLILYFLIKPSRILKTNRARPTKKQTKISRHGDYFEFDENEL